MLTNNNQTGHRTSHAAKVKILTCSFAHGMLLIRRPANELQGNVDISSEVYEVKHTGYELR